MDSKVVGGIETYESGAKRSSLGARWDLLSPVGLRRAAEAAHEGAEKYAAFNHEHGLPVHVYLNHAVAHIYSYLAGDRSEQHLGHAAWNLLFACQSEEVYPDLNAGHQRLPGCLPPKKEDIQ
jgi:hypothetical protein